MSSISYDKQIQLAKAEKERQETLSILDKGFQVADVFTNKQYLDNYSDADILSYNKHQVQNQSKLRIYQMTKIVFDKDENALDKLTSVYLFPLQ